MNPSNYIFYATANVGLPVRQRPILNYHWVRVLAIEMQPERASPTWT